MKKKISIGNTRSVLYKTARALGDINSLRIKTVGKRITNRVVGKISGKISSKISKLIIKFFP